MRDEADFYTQFRELLSRFGTKYDGWSMSEIMECGIPNLVSSSFDLALVMID
jgi:hypothetical protein